MNSLILLCVFAFAYAKHEMYIGYKSYYISPSHENEFQALASLENEYQIDVLTRPIFGRDGLVLVKPEYQESFLDALDKYGIKYRIHFDDVKAQLDYEDAILELRRNQTRSTERLSYTSYHDWPVIEEYIDGIAHRYPDLVKLVNAGRTFEGRNLKYLKISTTNFEDASKPVIVIDAAIHAREWATIPVATWAIHKLVEDVTEPDLLNNFDWIIFPVANPDGYTFSLNTQRFWRKTRSIVSPNTERCPGVDGNRNYDFHWNTVGTSTNPCAENYGGPKAFSEIETRIVRDILDEHLSRISLYLTIHSHGSMILYPWGHDGSLSHNALGLHTVGIEMANAIHTKALSYFPRYVVGNAALVLRYAASGASEDYAHSVGVPLSYTYELPGGGRGFFLDPIYIKQVATETWEGIVAGARKSEILFRA
ncbi:carboxypeptidase B [Bombyx mori]|uniref:Peptidase M14 domain-containing protein n=1 Tax=Bombyx mori TaxID=7091 RepID=A0A8R2QYK3_BOMMO|nr:carboxypeptidase B [Bombyx mori]